VIEVRITEFELFDRQQEVLRFFPKADPDKVKAEAFIDLLRDGGINTSEECEIVGKLEFSNYIIVRQE